MSIDLSRVENILETMLGRSEIKEPAQSRVEELLIELKEAIEEGGTGGDITALTARIAKCERDISSIETVDETQTQQIQSIVTSLGEFRTAIENLDTDVENKADKSTTYTKTEVDTALSAKQDTISDLATIRSGATLGATAVQPVPGKSLSTNDFTDAEKTKLDDHVVDTSNPHQVTKTQVGLGNVDNVATKDAIAELIDSGAKNLIQNAATSRTENGVTFTVNTDGTVTLTGTASATIWFPIMTNMSIDAGTYTISNGLTDDTARVIISTTNSLSSRIFDSNESGYITKTVDAISGVTAYLRVASGKITNGIIVKPMLCTKAAGGISQEYVPYRPNYDELVARIEALERAGE